MKPLNLIHPGQFASTAQQNTTWMKPCSRTSAATPPQSPESKTSSLRWRQDTAWASMGRHWKSFFAKVSRLGTKSADRLVLTPSSRCSTTLCREVGGTAHRKGPNCHVQQDAIFPGLSPGTKSRWDAKIDNSFINIRAASLDWSNTHGPFHGMRPSNIQRPARPKSHYTPNARLGKVCQGCRRLGNPVNSGWECWDQRINENSIVNNKL